MASQRLNIVETDEAGKRLAMYVVSKNAGDKEERIDVVHPDTAQETTGQTLLDIFLPAGFPHSVTSDYVEYQIYDSLQAFASSIAGLLSSRAVLSSIGVGDATGSPTAALIFNVLQETSGRVATILFAWRFGTVIEPECKMYRLLADVLNDCAFVIDCLSPLLPRPFRLLALTSSAVLRSLCGVAAGSAKASLSAHFAVWGNLGELNAKDSSQETVISLLGLLVGSLVVSRIDTPLSTWTALILLLAVHLEMNRRAVRAVALTTLNRQRAGIVFHCLRKGNVPSPKEVSEMETIFERAGSLRNADGRTIGFCNIGASLSEFLATTAQHSVTGSAKLNDGAMESLLRPFAGKRHVLWYDLISVGDVVHINIALKTGATAQDMLLAWWHAVALADAIDRERPHSDTKSKKAGDDETATDRSTQGSSLLQRSMQEASQLLETYSDKLLNHGWDLDSNALETRPSTRLATGDE